MVAFLPPSLLPHGQLLVVATVLIITAATHHAARSLLREPLALWVIAPTAAAAALAFALTAADTAAACTPAPSGLVVVKVGLPPQLAPWPSLRPMPIR
jgi:hypothetical protein